MKTPNENYVKERENFELTTSLGLRSTCCCIAFRKEGPVVLYLCAFENFLCSSASEMSIIPSTNCDSSFKKSQSNAFHFQTYSNGKCAKSDLYVF